MYSKISDSMSKYLKRLHNMYVAEKLIHDCILLYCKDMIFIYWISNITCEISIQTFIPVNVSLADKSQYSKIKESKFKKIKKKHFIKYKIKFLDQ